MTIFTRFKFGLKAYIRNMKLKGKFIFIIWFVAILVGSCSLISMRYTIRTYNTILYQQTADSLSYFAKETESAIKSVTSFTNFIISDTSIQDSLEALKGDVPRLDKNVLNKKIYQSIYGYFSFNKYIISVSIIQGDNVISFGLDSSQENPSVNKILLEKASENNGKEYWMSTGRSDCSVICARSIRKIQNLDLKELGILVVRVDLEKIVQDSTTFINGTVQHPTFSILADNQLIYPAASPQLETLTKKVQSDSDYDIMNIDGQKQFVLSKTMDYPEWSYIESISYNKIFNSIIFSNVLNGILLILSVGISIFVADILIKNITRHFDTLVDKMNSFKKGNMQPLDVHYDYTVRQDELGVLHQHFDDMISEFADLIEDNYVKQLLLKDARIKTLEQQINPHFLYNTLESINWRAKMIGDKEISIMAESLGNLLRSTISEKSDVIPLFKELSIVECYIQIQKMRFDERLEFYTDIDDSLYNEMIPKMSIQPLIENAIKYSLETITETCTIRLSAQKEADCMVIRVENNGSEIDENILEKLEKEELKPHGCGIGLANIDSRIKLLFGKEYGLSFSNEEDKAIVTIHFPIKRR